MMIIIIIISSSSSSILIIIIIITSSPRLYNYASANTWPFLETKGRPCRQIFQGSRLSIISLVGGLEHFFMCPYIGNILGILILTDYHIFHRGWNHQTVHHLFHSSPFQLGDIAGKSEMFGYSSPEVTFSILSMTIAPPSNPLKPGTSMS